MKVEIVSFSEIETIKGFVIYYNGIEDLNEDICNKLNKEEADGVFLLINDYDVNLISEILYMAKNGIKICEKEIIGVISVRGSFFSHGAILLRENRIPAVIINEAKKYIKNGSLISIDFNKGIFSFLKN